MKMILTRNSITISGSERNCLLKMKRQGLSQYPAQRPYDGKEFHLSPVRPGEYRYSISAIHQGHLFDCEVGYARFA